MARVRMLEPSTSGQFVRRNTDPKTSPPKYLSAPKFRRRRDEGVTWLGGIGDPPEGDLGPGERRTGRVFARIVTPLALPSCPGSSRTRSSEDYFRLAWHLHG